MQNYTIYNTNIQNSIINTLTNLQSTIHGLQRGTAKNNDVIALQNIPNSLITNVKTNTNNITILQTTTHSIFNLNANSFLLAHYSSRTLLKKWRYKYKSYL